MRYVDSEMSKTSESKHGKLINISEEQEVQIFAKQMLAKRLFVGHYQERRYVEPLNAYRDIVRISDAEDELLRDVNIVRNRIQNFYPPHTIWTGLTASDTAGAPAGCCLWVKLSNLPLGHYWFQIREVKINEKEEIYLRLRCMRSVNGDEGSLKSCSLSERSTVSSESLNDINSPSQDDTDKRPVINIQQILSSVKDFKYDELIARWVLAVSTLFTFQNMKEVLTFLVVLIVSSATGLIQFIMYLGDFSLKLMREISYFIHACTPVFLGIIDFFSKCIGGLYILLAMLWRGSAPQFPSQQPFRPPKPLPLAYMPESARQHQNTSSRPVRYTRSR